jgi:hypothetical protein
MSRPEDRPPAGPAVGRVVVGLFADGGAGQAALNALVRVGLPRDRISVVARDEVMERTMPGGGAGGGRPADAPPAPPAGGTRPKPDNVAREAGVAAVDVPGMGHLLAAGPLLAGAGGPAHGGYGRGDADSLVLALTARGLAAEDARSCVEAVRAGRVLLAVETGGALAAEAETVLRDAGAERTIAGAG